MSDRKNFTELGSASSLLTDLILETGGQSIIGEAELFLIRHIDIPAFAKSWIVFQSLGLRDASTRREIANGFQPWNAPDVSSMWVFNALSTSVGEFSVEEAKAEWRAFMYYWKNKTINSSIIEVHTISSQFNFQVLMLDNRQPSTVMDALNLFVQPLNEDDFNTLSALNYQFLHKG